MKRILVLLFAVLAFSSCSTAVKYISLEQSYNDDWVGRSHADIVSTYGAPDRVESDGLDGNILVYETVTAVTEYDTVSKYEKDFTHFFIGADRRCYAVKTNLVEADPASVKKAKTAFWTSYGVTCGVLFLIAAVAAM